jgi:hypothetical protein
MIMNDALSPHHDLVKPMSKYLGRASRPTPTGSDRRRNEADYRRAGERQRSC